MKKALRLFAVIIITLSILLITPNVFAQSNMKVTKKTYINTGIGTRKEAKFYTNKGYAYCITPHKTGPQQGKVLYYKSRTSSGGVLYLLEKAKTSDTSYLTTQLAIWQYDSNYMPSVYTQNSSKSVVQEAKKLAKLAKENANYNTTPKVSISPTTSTMAETGNYYKSNAFKITATNITSNITVTLSGAPSGSKITDSNGNVKSSFNNGDTIYVMTPVSSVSKQTSFKITIKGSGNVSYVERYATSESKWQELVVLVKEPKTVTATATLTINPVVRKCEYYNGKYYDKDGKETDKTTYSIQCEKHTCELVGNTYFGKDGTIVDKDTYSKECEKHTCEKVGDEYFGKEGIIVDETTYKLECEKHTCEIVGDKYFGKNGYEVDQLTYSKECEKHTCEVIGDTYFGKDGSEITSEEYTIQCEKHTCEIIGDNYFGSDGQITTPEIYKQQCEAEVVPVPDTGTSTQGIIYIIIGSVILGATFIFLENYSNKKNISYK